MYTVEDYEAENVIMTTEDREAALAVALELGERDDISISLSNDDGCCVFVNEFRKAFFQALATGVGIEAMGDSPLYRGDVMNEEYDTDRFDVSKVYDSDSQTPVVGWKESIRDWI